MTGTERRGVFFAIELRAGDGEERDHGCALRRGEAQQRRGVLRADAGAIEHEDAGFLEHGVEFLDVALFENVDAHGPADEALIEHLLRGGMSAVEDDGAVFDDVHPADLFLAVFAIRGDLEGHFEKEVRSFANLGDA